MNKHISRIASAVLAVSMMTSGASALPASAYDSFAADSARCFSFGAFNNKKPAVSPTYSSSSKAVKISWSKVPGATGYRIYRKVDGGKYKVIAEVKKSKRSYKDKTVSPGTQYSYKVKAFKGSVKRKYTKASKPVHTVTAPTKVKEIKKVWGEGVNAKLSWSKVADCDGYIVYYYTFDYNTGKVKWKKAKTIDSPDTVSASIDLSTLACYDVYDPVAQFCVKSYSADKKGKIKTAAASATDIYMDMDTMSMYSQESMELLAQVEKGKSKTTFVNENTQPKKSEFSDGYITDADLKAIEKFAKNHFAADWTDEQKVLYTLYWINRNVTYDDEYSHIRPGYADCIFEGRWGQCAQYNGALIEMMSYLGYEATLIMGFRGYDTANQWQHFWGEVEVDGTKYVMETGNYGKNGSWMYYCTGYKYAGGYIKNKKCVEK